MCIPGGTDFRQVRQGVITATAAALAVRRSGASPALVAEAAAVSTVAVTVAGDGRGDRPRLVPGGLRGRLPIPAADTGRRGGVTM